MGNKWRPSTWGDEVSLEYGKSLKGYREADGPIQVFGSNGAVGWTNKALSDGPGVILGRKGAYRGVRYTESPFYVIDTAYYVKSKAEHHMRWLYYAIIHHKLGEIDDGSPIPSTTRSAVYVTDVDIPPLPEQKAIAHILGTLDDKIELNRWMNATLEGMAQALFKSWFVDFDPVIDNALAAGNPIPDELAARAEVRRQALANGTANREAAKPFPAAFQQTESMGWIPEGWEVHPLDKIANYQNGMALQKFRPKLGEDPLPVVKIAQLKTGDATWEELASPSIKPECILDNGDVVFSWSGSLMVTLWCGGRAALNQHLFKVTSQEFPKWVYLYWTKKHLSDFQKIAADKAVTMGHIKRSHLAEAMCTLPPVDLIEEGTQILSTIIDQLIKNDLVSRSFARLRDTLLPKLVSGELRVSEAEQLTEGVL